MRWASNFPVPGSPVGRNEVKIKVQSVGLNPIDYKIPELPFVSWLKKATPVGVELAGEVVEVGTAVRSVKVGDAVFGGCSRGSLAELAVSSESEISRLPEGVEVRKAGSYAAVALTALQALRAGGVEVGRMGKNEKKRVLILGASGGVGHVALQMAKKISGCEYVCGVASEKNREFVKKMGADEMLDYTRKEFKLSSFCEGEESKYDMVFDAVSNPKFSYEEEARKCLKQSAAGEYVAINTAKFSDWPRAAVTQATGWGFFQRKNFKLIMCKFDAEDIRQIGEWISEGKLNVEIAKTVPFTEAGLKEGFDQLKTERTVGKILVDFSS
jgi:NADPH:quinone reductase-like Zn-dependent oxidoreductase